jgi:hypothetical protein
MKIITISITIIITYPHIFVEETLLHEGDAQTTHNAIQKSPGIKINDTSKGICFVRA